MKPTAPLRSLLAALGGSILAISYAHSATYYFDGGGTTTTGLGWGTASNWSDDLAGTIDSTDSPITGDDVIFSITGAAEGVVGMNAARAANSLTFSSAVANTLMAHTTANTNNSLTIGSGGITIDSGAGDVTFGVTGRGTLTTTLGASQSWAHNGGNLFSVTQAVALGANTLTLSGSGSGNTTIGGAIAGSGGAVAIDRSGSGIVTLSGTNTFTGQLTVARGTLSIASINNASSNGVLGNSASAVILGSSGQTGTLRYTGATASSTKLFSLATGGTGVFDVTTAATNLTLSGAIGGSGNLTKLGDGRLILTSASNNHGGTTLVSSGFLRFGDNWDRSWNNGRLSANTNLEINGGTVEAYYYKTFTLGSAAGQLQITGGRSGFSNMQGDASGQAFVVFGSTSTTVDWGSDFFKPATLVLNDVGANTVLRTNNPLNLNGANRSIEVAATGVGGGRGTYGTWEGNISGTSAGLFKTGAGTLMLNGTNSYNGGTTINGGGVWFNRLVTMPNTGAVTVNDGGILSVSVGNTGGWTTGASGNGTIGGLLVGIGGQSGGTVSYVGNVNVGLNISGTQTYSADIANVGTSLGLHIGNKDSGTASDPFTAAGTLILSGNNSYTGITSINRGILRAGSANALGNGGDITFLGGTLQYVAASAANDYGSRIKNSTAAIALDTNGQNITLSGIAAGNNGGLTKSGAGKLTLTGTNTYGGLTTLSGGSIEVVNGTVSGGGLSFGADNLNFSILGGSSSATWNAGNGNFGTVNSTRNNVQMLIDGDGVEGSAVLTNVNLLVWGYTHTNSTITLTDGGQLNVNGETRIGNPYYSTVGGANMTIGGGTATSTFSGDGGDDFYIGYGERENSNNNVVTVSSGGVLTNIRDMFVGHVNNQQGNNLASTANRLTVTGTGTASMRSLSIGYAQNAGAPPTNPIEKANANVVEVTSGGTLTTSGTATNYIGRANNNYTESNANTLTVTGTGSSWNAGNQNVVVGYTTSTTATSNDNILTIGAGASLTNVNNLIVGDGTGTETGNQLVVDGSLTVNTLTVSTGNFLKGSGTINGVVTLSGILSPGLSPGTLTFNDDLTLNNGSTYVFEAGDLTAVLGELGLNDNWTLSLGTGFQDGGSVTLFTYGTLATSPDLVPTFDFTNLGFTPTSYSLTDTGSAIVLQGVSVIPEPRAALLGAIGFILLLRRRR